MEWNILFTIVFATLTPLLYADNAVSMREELMINCAVKSVTDIKFFFQQAQMEWHFQKVHRTIVIAQGLNVTGTSKYAMDVHICNGINDCKGKGMSMETGIIFSLIIKNVTDYDNGLYYCLVMYNGYSVRSVAIIGNKDTTEIDNGEIIFTDGVSIKEAIKKCHSYGYELAIIPDDSKDALKGHLSENETVWIGSYPWLYMAGCFSSNAVNKSKSSGECGTVDIKNNLTATLNIKAVGIHNGTCYFFDRLPLEDQISEFYCNLKCLDLVEGNCGGSDALSLYTFVHAFTKHLEDLEECMTLQLDIDGYLWRIPCTSFCDETCQVYDSRGSILFNQNPKFKKWRSALENCIYKNASLPGIGVDDYANFRLHNDSLLCLGMFRNSFTMNVTQIVRVQKKREGLTFSKMTETVKLPFICKSRNGEAHEMTVYYCNDSQNSGRSLACSRSQEIINQSSTSEKPYDHHTTSTSTVKKLQAISSINLTMVLAITCSVVGLIALIAVLICLKARLCKKNTGKKRHDSSNSEEMRELRNTTNNECPDIFVPVNYDYSGSVTPEQNKFSDGRIHNYSDVEKRETEYVEMEAGEYDLLRTNRKRKEDCNDETVYDRTDHSLGNFYDVTNRNLNSDKQDIDDYYSDVTDQPTAIKHSNVVGRENYCSGALNQ